MKKTKAKRDKKFRPNKAAGLTGEPERAVRMFAYLRSMSMRHQELGAKEISNLMLDLYQALDSILAGTGTDSQAALIGGHFNMVSKMVDLNLAGSAAYRHIVEHAREALMDMAARKDRTGRWGLTGPGIQAVRDLIQLRDALLQSDENTVGLEAAISHAIDSDVERGHVEKAWA